MASWMTLFRITRRMSCDALRAERRTDAHLARALRHGERHHAVEAGRGEKQRADAERHEEGAEDRVEPRLPIDHASASCWIS